MIRCVLFKSGVQAASKAGELLAVEETDLSVPRMTANVTAIMNGTQPPSCFKPTAKRIGETFVYCLLFVVSLTGNTIIGIIVYKTKNMRKPINFFIVNMAMSDLLFPIFMFPYLLTGLYVGSWPGGPFGQASCKLVVFFADVSATVSVQNLVLIAVDRFGAVVFPLRFPVIRSKLCPFYILATWIIAMAVHCPDLILTKLVEYPQGLACVWQRNEVFGESSSFENYVVAVFVVFRYIPLVLTAILYLTIAFKIKSHTIPGEQSVNAREQRVKRERNVLKMSIAIVLVFAACWLPFTIYWFLTIFSSDSTMIWSCGFQYFNSVAVFLACSNCAINPYICYIFSGNYRQGLKNLLSCFSATIPGLIQLHCS